MGDLPDAVRTHFMVSENKKATLLTKLLLHETHPCIMLVTR